MWYFGDKHLPFDIIGKIGKEDILVIINYLKQIDNEISIAFEVAKNKRYDFLLDFPSSYNYICFLQNNYVNF